MTAPDPRPLTGEPLALDLLNTRWDDGDRIPCDLLTDTAGLAVWLSAAALPEEAAGRWTADQYTLLALRETRDALAAAARSPLKPSALAVRAVNSQLAYGRRRLQLGTDGRPASTVAVDDPSRLVGWLAAENYLALLERAPTRIRACAAERCPLFFFDVSLNGRRRWCSMSTCGNRNKAARFSAARRGGSRV
jgi:predicted RNA-binding Zn ribbon-like protein